MMICRARREEDTNKMKNKPGIKSVGEMRHPPDGLVAVYFHAFARFSGN